MRISNKQIKELKKGRIIGVATTLIIHALLFVIGISAPIKETIEIPTNNGILIEFIEEEIKPIEVKSGVQPKAVDASPENEIKLVQKSEGQELGTQTNEGEEVTIGPDGDVEKYEPPQPKPIDKRALFTSANNNKDTIAPQTADRISESLTAGHAQGNTRVGDISDAPSAKLEGRSTVGSLPLPSYNVNKEGRVIVTIRVDQYGKVINAIPGATGTTVPDKSLWNAAKEAALKAQFNVSSKAAAIQEGTITYIFKLK